MFLAALLLALASALVPALFPSGIASTRIAGSAFDPTTSAVTLRGRAQAIVHEATDENQGKAPDTDVAPPLPAKAPQETPLLQIRHRSTNLIVTPAPHMAARRITSAQPRAPPFPIA
jgi:hypothetical protein